MAERSEEAKNMDGKIQADYNDASLCDTAKALEQTPLDSLDFQALRTWA
jgi:hypothetical protein